MAKSSIEWTDATWNPVTGCTKVSPGCKHCYAEGIANRFWGPRKFTEVQCHPERLEQPLRWRNPRMVFVNSMSDLFHEAVPDEFIYRILAVIGLTPRHRYQVLTKRPQRMRDCMLHLAKSLVSLETAARRMKHTFKFELDGREYSLLPFPIQNLDLGVSVENQAAADERIPPLLQTLAAVRFVSCEPLLGPLTLRSVHAEGIEYDTLSGLRSRGHGDRLDWVIVGGESGPGARPMNPEWVRFIRDQCRFAGVPFFFKQWGGPNKKQAGRVLDGRTWDEMPGAPRGARE